MDNDIKTVAVIGAGFLGYEICSQVASYNFTVRIFDVNTEKLKLFTRKIMRKKKKKGAMGEVTYHQTLTEAVADADLIIEAVPENLELKKDVFSQIDKAAPPHAIIATNSSSIPVSKIEDAVSVPRKDKVLNLHFYHRAVPMVDIMRGTQTTEETFNTGKMFLENIQLTPLEVKRECLGFVFNRIWHATKKEALNSWAKGYADIETIDASWKIFTGMSLGIFEIMDNIGLDTVYSVEMTYYKESGDDRDKPPQALKDMIDRGEIGVKTNKGFYTY